MFEGKLATLGGLVAAAVLGVSLPVWAQPLLRSQPFGESHGAANPPVARYLASQGRAFILDRSAIAPEALLKFDDNFEVWVLEPAQAPGYATIYRNDAGEQVVKVTKLGGVTLYTAREPDGVPVSIQGDAEDLSLPQSIPDKIMTQLVPQASYRISRAAQTAVGHDREVNISAPYYTPATAPVFADAITVTANALVTLARRKEAKAFLSKLDQVLFIPGPRPDVGFNGSVLTITLTPGKGYAGRPSSNRILKTCLKR
jgi:Domain of unknown function (DUF4908)